jgi:phospholipid transport system transporter-binding protein
VIERGGEWLVVRGSLTMETVPALFESGLQQLAGDDLHVDFSQVDSVDSAAVSMLLGWSRAARRLHHELRVKSLPEDLLSLAHLYGVAEMLPNQSD